MVQTLESLGLSGRVDSPANTNNNPRAVFSLKFSLAGKGQFLTRGPILEIPETFRAT